MSYFECTGGSNYNFIIGYIKTIQTRGQYNNSKGSIIEQDAGNKWKNYLQQPTAGYIKFNCIKNCYVLLNIIAATYSTPNTGGESKVYYLLNGTNGFSSAWYGAAGKGGAYSYGMVIQKLVVGDNIEMHNTDNGRSQFRAQFFIVEDKFAEYINNYLDNTLYE